MDSHIESLNNKYLKVGKVERIGKTGKVVLNGRWEVEGRLREQLCYLLGDGALDRLDQLIGSLLDSSFFGVVDLRALILVLLSPAVLRILDSNFDSPFSRK